MPGGPRATTIVLYYREPIAKDESKPKLDPNDAGYLKELGYECNRNGELCQRDGRGHLYPVDDRGARKYQQRQGCP